MGKDWCCKNEGKGCTGPAPSPAPQPPAPQPPAPQPPAPQPLPGQLCFESEGGQCLSKQEAPNGVTCFTTLADCEKCWKQEGSICALMQQAPNGADCFLTEEQCNQQIQPAPAPQPLP